MSGRAEVAVAPPGPAARGSAWPRPFLTPLAWACGLAVRARNRAYETGWLRVHRLPCRVIAVGNLALGGTGKTPMAIAVAQALQAAGRRAAILIRGYRGTAGAEVAVVSDGERVGMDARQAGDEAVLLARRLPGVPVIRGADRVAAGRLAMTQFGAQALVLDDGFQHRRIARDLDLLLLDARDPFAGGALVPAGRLREPAAAVARADLVILTRRGRARDTRPARRALADLGAREILECDHAASGLVALESGAVEPASRLAGRRVFAFSGIGDPVTLAETLAALGAVIAGARAFRDHYAYRAQDLEDLARSAAQRGAEMAITTEKDAVRLGGLAPPRGLDLRVLQIGIAFPSGRERFEAALRQAMG